MKHQNRKMYIYTVGTVHNKMCNVLRIIYMICGLVSWLCLTSHRQRGHLEKAPPFTVPCEGREAR